MTTPNTPTVAELLKEWEQKISFMQLAERNFLHCTAEPANHYNVIAIALQEAVEVLKTIPESQALLNKWGLKHEAEEYE